MPDQDTVRVGIVGLGGMGTTHAGNIERYGHEVIAGADIVPESREEFSRRYDATTYENYETLYNNEDVDAVVITTPNKFHEPASVAALERDIYVLCEKPLAHDLSAAERIVDAAHASDAFCMVGFHNRLTGAIEMFKAYQDEGRFGDVAHVHANYVRRRGIPALGSWFTNKELSGGGALIDIGVHTIDLALYLLDFPEIAEVTGVTRSNFGTKDDYVDPDNWAGNWDIQSNVFDVDDSASAFIRTVDGATIALEVSWAANTETSNEFVVRGTEAGARFDIGRETLEVWETSHAGLDHYIDSKHAGNLEIKGHEAEDRLFVDSVLSGEAPSINTVDEGLTVQRVIDAIYRSSEEGSAVSL